MELVLYIVRNYWKAVFEILLLAAVIYYLLLLFRGTRGAAVLTGLVLALLILTGLTRIFELDVMNAILSRVVALLAIAVLVIFQPEIRKALAQIGSQQFFTSSKQRGQLIDVLVETARALSQRHLGALMAIEREIGFRGLQETGVALDARAAPELLATIFQANSPLHDGGVVLRGDRVAAAGCVFPLTQQHGLSTQLGMRHRAALGLSEETDAVVIVVSEETGSISVAHRGHLLQNVDPEVLRSYLAGTLAPPARPANVIVDSVRKWISSFLSTRTPVSTEEPLPAAADTSEKPPPTEPRPTQREVRP